MKPLFADTFFFLALINNRESAHQQAAEAEAAGTRLLTSGFIILELADFLCDAPNRTVFERLFRTLTSNSRVEIVPISQTIVDRAVELYFDRPDKDWSLTDCTSFIIMQDRAVTDALTGDRHFEQAGFRALLTETS